MPVVLSLIPEKKEPPQPPRLLTWAILLFLALSIGFIFTVFIFKPEGSERSLWFWGQAVLMPTIFWLLLFCIRFHLYERDVKYTESWNKHHDNRRKELTEFAQRPLVLLSQSIVTGAGRFGHAAAVTNNLLKINSTKPINGDVPIPHSSIAKDNSFDSVTDLLTYVMICLKNNLKLPKIEESKNQKLKVKLIVDCGLNNQEILNIWHKCWDKNLPQETYIELLPKENDLMILDEWLDDLQNDYSYLLVVSIQLYHRAIKNGAEAAIAMLFAGEKIKLSDYSSLTFIHRPVKGEIAQSLSDAILWGKNKASDIESIWSSEGNKTYLTEMIISFNNIVDMTPDVYRINSALGYAGVAAGWLTLAIAIEQSQISKNPQLVSYSNNHNVFMMINHQITPEIKASYLKS